MDYFAAMKAFVDCADLGSFSKAAERAGVKPSTVSRYISGLEADLGAALFNRSTRRIHLTEVGRTFYVRAADILGELEDARFAASSLNAKPQGDLRINAPGAFGRKHIAPHLAAFRELHPDIRINAEFTETPLDLIRNGVDVAIRTGLLEDSTLIATRLGDERSLLVATSRYLATAPQLLAPADVTLHECLLMSHEPTIWFFSRTGHDHASRLEVGVNGSVRINDPQALLQMTLHDQGLALLPSWLAGEEIQSGKLQEVLPEWHVSPLKKGDPGIWGVYPPKRVVSPKVAAFLNFYGGIFGRGSRRI